MHYIGYFRGKDIFVLFTRLLPPTSLSHFVKIRINSEKIKSFCVKIKTFHVKTSSVRIIVNIFRKCQLQGSLVFPNSGSLKQITQENNCYRFSNLLWLTCTCYLFNILTHHPSRPHTFAGRKSENMSWSKKCYSQCRT